MNASSGTDSLHASFNSVRRTSAREMKIKTSSVFFLFSSLSCWRRTAFLPTLCALKVSSKAFHAAWVGLEPAGSYSAGARGSGPDDGSDQGIRTI
jgi:hypothetical protein